jgi:methyltransferase (TIGR00027 family)
MAKRIETITSRTAELTCISRAFSVMEKRKYYKSDDSIAPLLLPTWFRNTIRLPFARTIFTRVVAPKGIYEYVISRTKYIDSVFNQAILQNFNQILIFGAGFDSRAIRFQNKIGQIKIFELDVIVTQQSKIKQYQRRKLMIPENLTFIPIHFDKDSLSNKLDESGFQKDLKSLFILEGLIMYLQPESVDFTFRTIQDYSGQGSWIVFDTVHDSVIKQVGKHYGEYGIVETVSKAGERWTFGLNEEQMIQFLKIYGMELKDQKNSRDLEIDYFTTPEGEKVGRVNGTHFLVTAEHK